MMSILHRIAFFALLIPSAAYCLWLPTNPANVPLVMLVGVAVLMSWYSVCESFS